VHRVHEAIADAAIAGDVPLAQHRMQRHLAALAAALGA
jgi:DNA-binding GntR family transcriptional regulator